jgi:hypothetical protein
MDPEGVALGAAGFTLTVTGTNFVPQSVIRWNGAEQTTTFISSNVVTALISGSKLYGFDSATITVFNPPPDGGNSNSAIFSVFRQLTLPTNDLIYDRFSRRIYASVPGTASSGNSNHTDRSVCGQYRDTCVCGKRAWQTGYFR